ncbi:hypothetical protein N8J89_16295 [Crossiella sp. CA-258035]|uniref:hypothetical protein n=1 Tax=Crossiella sp. CA-258035 TaxID=2981138 RepID=UPI0024BD0AB9|nr:hypothetical protein [Crossiella sp. CA-258035]WHT22559.1 hypothetical protein N8J89_16295 [Crossiella sp. CA-258035]
MSLIKPRRALLIDLDNITYQDGSRVSAACLRGRLEAVLARTGPVDHVLAAGPPSTVARYLAELVELRVPVVTSTSRSRKADTVLIERAEHLISTGYTEIVLASACGRFSVLCGRAGVSVTIVCVAADAVARELRAGATEVLAVC